MKVVSPGGAEVRAWADKDWGSKYTADADLDDVGVDDFDALVLPSGVLNPNALRIIPSAVAFVKAFFDAGKPVPAVCHGPWMILEAGGARGRQLTSWPSLRTDLGNAGATQVDQEVVVDGNLITNRKPDDLSAFNRELLALLAH